MIDANEQGLWENPRRWPVLRRAQRRKVLGVGMILAATLALIPSLWILTMPQDPLFRPDLTQVPAVITLIVCAALFSFGRSMGKRNRIAYGAALYGCINQARQAGARSNLIFDIELPQIFPRVLFARRHRTMAVALPYPLLLSIDDIEAVTVVDDSMIRVSMKDPRKHAVTLLAGDGLSRQSPAETRYVADRLQEFIFMMPAVQTEAERQQEELARAFLDNPLLR